MKGKVNELFVQLQFYPFVDFKSFALVVGKLFMHIHGYIYDKLSKKFGYKRKSTNCQIDLIVRFPLIAY